MYKKYGNKVEFTIEYVCGHGNDSTETDVRIVSKKEISLATYNECGKFISSNKDEFMKVLKKIAFADKKISKKEISSKTDNPHNKKHTDTSVVNSIDKT
jgi:hypothetical protein